MSYSAREHYRPAQSNNQQYPSSEEERLTGTFTSFKSNKRERDRMAAAIQLQGNHRAPSPPLHGQETSPNKRTTAFIRRDREVSTTSKNYTYSRYTQSRQSSNLKSERRFSAMSENRPNDLSLCNRFEYSVSSKKRHPTAEEGTFKYSDRRITDEQQKFELNDLNDYSGFSGNFGYVGQLDTFRERDERFQTASRGQDTAGKTANSGGYGGLERFTFQKRDRRKDLMMISEHVGEDEMQENHPMNFQDYSHSHKKRENRDIYGSGGRRTNLDLSGSKFKGSNIREYSNTDRYSLRSSGKKFELKPEKLNFRKKIEREETRRLPPNGNRGYSPSGSSLEKPRYALKALRKSRSDFTQSPPLSSIKETLNRSKESFGKPNRGYGLEQSEYTYRSGGPGFGSRDNSWTTICPSKEGTEEAYSFKDRPYVPRSQRDFSKASRPTITTAYENDDSEIKIGYADDSYSLLRDDGSKFDDESKFRYSRLRTGDKFGYGYVEDDPRLQDPYARLAEARNYGYDPRKGEKRKFSGENLSHLNRRKSAISFNTSDRRSQNEISESKYGPYSSRKSSFRQKRRYPEYDQNSSSREFSSKENGSSDYTYHYHGDYNAWDDSSYQNDCYGDTSTSIPRNRILSSESKDYETPPLYQHHRPHRRRSKSPRRPQIDFEQPHQMYQYSDHTAENIITDELKRYSSGCFVSPTKLLESSSTRERKVLEIASNNSAYNGRYGRKITHNYNSKEFTEDGGSRISGLVESRDYGIVAKGVVAGSGSTPTTERVLACKENFGSTGDLRFVNLNGYTSTNNKNSSVSGVRYGYESNGHGAPGVPENRGRRSLGPVVGGASGSKLNEGVSSGGEGARRSFVSDKENKGGLYNNKEDEEKSRNFIKKKNRIGEVRGNRGGRRLHKDSDEHPEHSPEKYNTQPKSNTQPSQNQVKKRAEFERERLKNNKNKKEQLKSSKYLINGNLRAAYQSAEPASHAASRNLNSTTPNRFQYSSQLIDQNDLKIDIKTSDSSTGFRPPLAPESDRIAKHDPRPSFLKAKGGSRYMSESMHVLETDNLFPEPRNSAHNTKTVRNSYGNSNSDINNRPTRNPSLDSCLLQKEAKEAKSRSVKDGGTQSLQFGTGYAEIGGSITSTVRQISGRTKHAVSMEMASRSNFKSCYGFLKRVMVVIKDSEGCLPLRLELLDWRSKRVLYRSVFKGDFQRVIVQKNSMMLWAPSCKGSLKLMSYNLKLRKRVQSRFDTYVDSTSISAFFYDTKKELGLALIENNIFVIDLKNIRIIRRIELELDIEDFQNCTKTVKSFVYSSNNQILILVFERTDQYKGAKLMFFKLDLGSRGRHQASRNSTASYCRNFRILEVGGESSQGAGAIGGFGSISVDLSQNYALMTSPEGSRIPGFLMINLDEASAEFMSTIHFIGNQSGQLTQFQWLNGNRFILRQDKTKVKFGRVYKEINCINLEEAQLDFCGFINWCSSDPQYNAMMICQAKTILVYSLFGNERTESVKANSKA